MLSLADFRSIFLAPVKLALNPEYFSAYFFLQLVKLKKYGHSYFNLSPDPSPCLPAGRLIRRGGERKLGIEITAPKSTDF